MSTCWPRLAMPGGITYLMQDIGRKYVRYINHSYRRTGTLWEGRYKASLVDSEAYLLTCMRDIELNPVRACMVSHPGEYRWSSYGCNAAGNLEALIQPHPVYQAIDADEERRFYGYSGTVQDAHGV
jgi:putative transposase